jgi:hypothetical protein
MLQMPLKNARSGKSGGLVRDGDQHGAVTAFQFVSANRAIYAFATMCRAECLRQRLLCVAQAAAVGRCSGGRGTHRVHPRDQYSRQTFACCFDDSCASSARWSILDSSQRLRNLGSTSSPRRWMHSITFSWDGPSGTRTRITNESIPPTTRSQWSNASSQSDTLPMIG